MTRHTDKAFEQDLDTVRTSLLTMGAGVRRLTHQAVRALSERDEALCRAVIEGDADINRLEVDIDEHCRRILALRQPAASDLRLITTALKVVTDLERCGDLAVNIAERAQDLVPAAPLPTPPDLLRLAALAEEQLEHALEAFVAADANAAREVLRGDDRLDALFLALFNALLALMMEDARTIRRATGLLFVAKSLERLGDHALNIAEMVVYMVEGRDIRHPRSRALGDSGASRP